MSNTAFTIVLLLLSLSLIGVLLLQVRGNAGQIFGQAESTFRSRRGIERMLFRATIVIAVVWIAVAIINVRVAG
ncbi:MAG: preprotein translocase subunit SecG [Chloroflexi bacterium]|nr:preprotein translocase subunit SecG [Chloroflexota bacterium]MDA1296556.1 preprotein translocase subunit SecG [Chloroflexota bacterium]